MKKTILTMAIQAAVLGSVSMTALAADEVEVSQVKGNQPQQTAELEQQTIEKISVTGSRIKRDSFSLTTPIVGLTSDDISDAGLGSLAEVLVDQVPSIAEGVSNTNSQSSVQNTGLSTIDLRDLGTDRTLTLIDGRRVVSNSYSGNYVSLSTIPTAMVQKVEIITGGASAVYGSDAIAGVVNIITKQDKTGFEFNARGGETTNGGGREYTFDLGYGTDFAGDRGYLYASATYEEQKGLMASDRDRGLYESVYAYDTDEMCNAMKTEDGYRCMRDITPDDWRERSNDIPGGRFESNAWWYDGTELKEGFKEERDGFNTFENVILKVPEDSLAAAVKVDFDLTDDLKSYAQVQFSKNNSFRGGDAEGQDYNDAELYFDPVTGEAKTIAPGSIKPNNPFVPSVIGDMAGSSVSWDRRFNEVGPVETENERTTIRTWAGLQGYVFGDWTWDASVGYGTFKQRQQRYNEISIVKLNRALKAEYAEDGTTIQCIGEEAQADGCVPINIFGEGSITADAADYIRVNPYIHTDISQLNFLAYMSGELFEMPAGGVQSAFGVEYRKDTQEIKVDNELRSLAITFNDVPPFKGDVEVYEAFGEATLPLLRDVTAAHKLDLDVSLRLAQYSQKNIDGILPSYKLGLFWEPAADYALRANYATAHRAPGITELMSPPRGDYDSVTDICDGVEAGTEGRFAENCRKDPGVAAAIAANGVYEDEGGSKYSPNAGNEELIEEKADTYTLGFTMAPEFLPGFKFAVDYYDITVTNAISSFSNEDIQALCYDSDLAYGAENPYCADIKRDEEGQLTQIIQREQNLDEISTRGYDVAMDYKFDMDSWGDLKLRANWTHVLSYKVAYTAVDGTYFEEDYVGELSSGIFEDKATVSLTWQYEDLRLRWTTKYKGPMVDDYRRMESLEEALVENQQALDAGTGGVEDPETTLAFYDYGSYITHDFSVSYTMDVAKQTELRLYGGVRNIFDNQGPWIPASGVYNTGRGNYDSLYGGGVGRYAYLGAELKF
ncbi:TonB-dependent receptor plug domain-containing protein [Shewanella khirikhana]|uniref:Vitamin B12 transporter BtuB n=1 Tax=Shewanella khirikhana TaxID=1965282 RepID=A0ABM7CZ33_9GAMM|nr:TonB-dependent receptor [Shewanella khirikhana]AZQ09364.1 Vitamin B12 transporter BtuB precursor [Shewanella khirikhana]